MTRGKFIAALLFLGGIGVGLGRHVTSDFMMLAWFTLLGTVFIYRVLQLEKDSRNLRKILHSPRMLQYGGLIVSDKFAAKHSLMFTAVVAALKNDVDEYWVLEQIKNYNETTFDVVEYCKYVHSHIGDTHVGR